jgi:aldose 1-epimerase
MPSPSTFKALFGYIDEQEIHIYTLTNKTGNSVQITNYGGIITRWEGEDKNGQRSSIIVGFGELGKYIPNGPHFGAIIGRYANRIKGASFELNGIRYQLSKNNGNNILHGGWKGFDKKVWTVIEENENNNALVLQYISKDGEEGFPGNLKVTVTYQYTDLDELHIIYTAETDHPTPINLTNHPYFNLTGSVSNNIAEHLVYISAEHYLPVDNTGIPTGEIAKVRGTRFDFMQLKKIGQGIESGATEGYDHNYVLYRTGPNEPSAIVQEHSSGRTLEIFTDQPGIQFYTGNSLDGTMYTDDGLAISRQSALCLETQHYPDAPNQPSFPSTILYPGKPFRSVTTFRLSVSKV